MSAPREKPGTGVARKSETRAKRGAEAAAALHSEALEHALSKAWGLPVRIVATETVLDPSTLSAGESKRLKEFAAEPRRESYLRGRAALKELLAAAGVSPDTSKLRFPNPRFSLSHSATLAVAAGIPAGAAEGFGIDLELRPPPRIEAARFFMAPDEQARLVKAPPQTLLRVWTIKEAVFKADPNNAFTSVRAYRVEDLDALSGSIAFGKKSVLYRTFELPGGYLTFALLR
jgi:4'-phosphopantetheinyl transferase EntD